jgi:two-component system, sensor histidine kinase and response regulator
VGDFHDPRSDGLSESFKLYNVTSFVKRSSYENRIPINQNFCPYTLHLYPTAETRDRILTNQPLLYMLGTLAIFAFTSALFLVYNYWVEFRQKEIMICAIRESVNASELDKIVQDRTEVLQRTNEHLEIANNKIKKTAEMQLEHFACMSHEIRTPLNGINGLSSLVCEDLRRIDTLIDTKELANTSVKSMLSSSLEAMQIIVTSGELLRTIVDDVLDFAKLGSGKVEIEKTPNVELQDVLDTVIASVLCIDIVRTKKVSIQTKFEHDLPAYITTDGRRLQQILYNLLGNAVKFSSEGGIIELCVCHIDSGFVNGTSTLRFIVKDYGKGIPEDKFEAIFEPFIQAEGDRTEIKHGGTGLGLAITSRLVQALGGQILVDSVVGVWTKFTVNFSLEKDECFVQNEIIQKKPEALIDSIVFLVDDNDRTREQMKETFQNLQMRCIAFKTASELARHFSAVLSCPSDIEEGQRPIGIILTHKDLMDTQSWEQISTSNKYYKLRVLKFTSEIEMPDDNSNVHFHSLVRIIPVVLMNRIAKFVQQDDQLIQVPIQTPASISIDSQNSDSLTPSISDMRILVAEDNNVNQKVISRILQRLNIKHVVIVDNGQLAVDREAVEQFDVILMDMHMPILDGMDACLKIMSRNVGIGQHPRAKIIFLTALASDSFKDECFAAGAIGFLTKPCNLKRVEEALQNVVMSSTLLQNEAMVHI